MIQDIAPAKYYVDYAPAAPAADDYVFAFCGTSKRSHRLLLGTEADGNLTLPLVREVLAAGCTASCLQYLFATGSEEKRTRYFLLMSFEEEENSLQMEGYTYQQMRMLRSCRPQELCFAGMTAYQLFDWYRVNRYCGCCGSRMEPFPSERALRCPSCGNLVFPKICPAVIVGVIDPAYDADGERQKAQDRIVVTRYAGREYKGIALIAGFCEIGETPEDTVAREVLEEVGLRVKNIRYYKSQPWGFDSNLLLGFFCEVDGDTTIVRDRNELATAEWAERSSMENTQENLLALTGTMIDVFMRGLE